MTEAPEDSSEGLELCVRTRAKRPAKGWSLLMLHWTADREVSGVCIFQPELQVLGNLQRLKVRRCKELEGDVSGLESQQGNHSRRQGLVGFNCQLDTAWSKKEISMEELA